MARSLIQAHVDRWANCEGCHLWEGRRKVITWRGTVPCDVLFIGEAPGVSEDVIGFPFVGPAGGIMDKIVKEALDGIHLCGVCRKGRSLRPYPSRGVMDGCSPSHREEPPAAVRTAFTNMVCCIPWDETGRKTTEPPAESVDACVPRLEEFVEIADPHLIVCVGDVAAAWILPDRKGERQCLTEWEIPMVQIEHPASIGRKQLAVQGLAGQKAAVAIRAALEEILYPEDGGQTVIGG